MSNSKQKTLINNEVVYILFKLLLEYSLLMQNIYSYKSILNENKNKGVLSELKKQFALDVLVEFGDVCRKRAEGLNGNS